MEDDQELVFWCGRPIEELSREELIAALNIMGRLEQTARDSYMCLFEMWKLTRAGS